MPNAEWLAVLADVFRADPRVRGVETGAKPDPLSVAADVEVPDGGPLPRRADAGR